ncbi:MULTISPECIES: hypothetical protein [unclassified Leptolyngbya]|uniref:hypothetical protein n=1 Tax=unclassified Leptolyngbya TaxID=2650499 RepID=UPI003D3165B8
MMKIQRFAPVITVLLGCLLFLGINLIAPQNAMSSPQQSHYLIKPLHVDRVLYVQPRLALGNLAPDSLLVALEEISQQYTIKGSKLYTRHVNGREIPGLVVYTSPLTAQVVSE